MKVIETSCPILHAKILCIMGCSYRELSKYIKTHWADIDLGWERAVGGSTMILYGEETAPLFMIWTKRRYDIIALVHELLHMVAAIFTYKGIPFSARNDEAVAYYQEYWLAEFTGKASTCKFPKKLQRFKRKRNR